ncbi:hypothetical protein NBRC10512_001857 [Rhodotorula toruloides]|uniref:RHTO0S19e01354g1_1 n=2 Tax=Rhodotorula toruloides TaxID=5286 RepID=A0A061BH14_RHOTO|nr:uncharacterized protein RHTO_03707 [Rhodotorula toruloides NP11]EMS20173.1 hypothetical protein RHTO_03707 [Rhodotorula toruloides NP11]CDR48639.1 RHTO0S19e01354g1_1 [Rhodotorula toruloides]
MPALQVSYTIAKPASSPNAPPATATFEHPVDSSTPLSHLQSLENALGEARKQMNERLTEWKEQLKDVEKPAKKGKKKDAEEDEDEQEEEDEA